MTTKPRRHKTIEVICENCGLPFQAIVRNGTGRKIARYCSNKCYGKGSRKPNKLYVGKENAKRVLNKQQGRYSVYWFDPETLERHNMSYARWWWEINKGEIPEGYRASFVDGNPLNIDPDNIVLVSPQEYGCLISNKLMGHEVDLDTRNLLY